MPAVTAAVLQRCYTADLPGKQYAQEQDASKLCRYVPFGVDAYLALAAFFASATAVTAAVLQRCRMADLPGKQFAKEQDKAKSGRSICLSI